MGMLWVVIGFLIISLLFYCVLGGADFGAGALELFVSRKNRKRHEEIVNKAMGPVWEANHIWLIILIVILFNAFPRVYTQYSIYFHVPLTLMLLGIVFRGCAFTFRNYDAVKDDTHRYYTLAFALSSLLTPIMFGMIMGGMFFGVDPHATTYYQKYVAPWFNLPSLTIGIFVLSMFAYLASVFLIGESDDKTTRNYYIRYARKTSAILLIAGALVFFMAQFSCHPLLRLFFTNPASIICFIAATILTLIFWHRMLRGEFSEWTIRIIAGSQVGLVLLAWLAVIFPYVLFYRDGTQLSLLESAAPIAVINVLAWSLLIGALLFLPILYYLIRIFKVIE
jgi:cytochrome d ubiquinol oxidase subunit II